MIEEITQPHQKVEDRVVQDLGTGERSQKKAHLGTSKSFKLFSFLLNVFFLSFMALLIYWIHVYD